MSDMIVGLSVLQPIWIDGIYRLWFEAQKNDGTQNQGWIFIRDAAAQSLPEKMPDYPDSCNSIWKFTRNNPFLNCTPSVNWLSWGFHNEYAWMTRYVEMTYAERAESKAGPEPTRYQRGSAVHYDLNIEGLKQEDQQKMIEEFNHLGLLKV